MRPKAHPRQDRCRGRCCCRSSAPQRRTGGPAARGLATLRCRTRDVTRHTCCSALAGRKTCRANMMRRIGVEGEGNRWIDENGGSRRNRRGKALVPRSRAHAKENVIASVHTGHGSQLSLSKRSQDAIFPRRIVRCRSHSQGEQKKRTRSARVHVMTASIAKRQKVFASGHPPDYCSTDSLLAYLPRA
jgi:hypothetical protein